jgi:hypothetical protein
MTKVHLYGEDYEVFDTETQVRVPAGSLIASLAKTFLLQTPDRQKAHVAFLGTGGEAYGLAVQALRLDDELAEHLHAQLTVVEVGKK